MPSYVRISFWYYRCCRQFCGHWLLVYMFQQAAGAGAYELWLCVAGGGGGSSSSMSSFESPPPPGGLVSPNPKIQILDVYNYYIIY